MSTSPPVGLVPFGEFEADLGSRELRRQGVKLRLPDQSFQVLVMLLEHRGQLVPREEIHKKLWPGDTFVDFDHGLNNAVNRLREVLGDSADTPRFVETLPRRGYRFIAPVIKPESAKEPATTPSQSPVTESLTGTKVSHYRVLQLLGGGGMGVVYQGEDLKLGRQVAMKFLPGELASDPVAFERLQREARAASALDHPNICAIYELAEHAGRPFIVMQLLEGETLRQWIENSVRQSTHARLNPLLDLAIQIADGLAAAHQKGVIHRDIKPANIFITSRGEAKILDFGVAKFLELPELAPQLAQSLQEGGMAANPSLTRTGASVGTPYYLSPEQIRGEKLDARTDLFSLGLVLYEMATGHRAFAGDTAPAIREAVLNQSAIPARQLVPELPLELQRIITKALEKDRERRYQSAAELKTDLERLRQENRGMAKPSPQFLSRRAVLVGAIAVVVAALALLSINLSRTNRVPFATTKTTRLTGDGQTFKAAISPDGRYIAHTSLVAGQESLRVRRATTLNDIEIVPPQTVRYIGITFSPDSETIYYVVRTDGAEPPSLYRVAAMGGSSEKLKVRLDSPVTLSPNGKKLAFVRESTTESQLIVADLEAGGEQTLISRKLPRVLDYPAWSPDGQVIACTDTDSAVASTKGSDTRIIEVRVVDRAQKILSAHAWGFIRQLAWLGDGRGLVMSARGQEESGNFRVWYVSYPDGNERKVTEGLNSQMGASVSADSRQIVTVEESSFSSSIWRVPSVRFQDPQLVVSGSSGWSAPGWTRQRRIVFEEELNGRRSIWTVDTDGTNRKELTLTGNNYDPSVSRNGGNVAWVSDRNGSPAIWTMDMDGGNLAMVVKASGESFPQLSPDGKWITFTVIGSEHWTTLWRVASAGGQAIQLNNRLWQRPVISPDGKWIAGFYADHELSTQKFPECIAIIGIDGGQVRKMLPIPLSVSLSAGIRWSPDGRQLSYVNRGKDGDDIWSFRLDHGAPQRITHFHGLVLIGFDWSPDGQQLVFSRGVQTREVVLVEDTGPK
ncbi:MAG TPA: protein kinase [Terriglobales bacterium]|nr:protein kinase [Terriglobales bacterium]